ncbi:MULTISPECIES: metal ABC transporter substrate-binding protein [Salinibaculum]|uniref:metal ABC transporter substrate-binding protein n=1 Tax=Salinibaculum TaxID=2732368 RepID=UPI0030D56A8F
MNLSRRRLLSAALATAGTGLLAGCTGDASDSPGSEPGRKTAVSSFFVFGDITAQVAGDAAEANLLVPVGQHGHGWEPGPRVRADIHDADLLVHGMAGFQPWVDDIRGDLEADGSNVTTVDVSRGLSLLEPGGAHDDHDAHDSHAEDSHDEDHQEGTHDGEEHGRGMDPHFWLDPLRVKEAVGNVRAGLATVDSDNAETYARNAETVRGRLDDLHETIESTVGAASDRPLLVAGHDSFQYFGDRYGVEVEALTNVSPDDRPTTRDIEHAQEIIRAHDLQYICADPLESQQAATQLVAETDAEAVLPLTAMPGLTDEWADDDWGYVEVMENVNVPTLERALDE